LLVTHNLGVIPQLCERAIYLKDGRIEAMGPGAEMIGRYDSVWSVETGAL
jgi:ABC-type polysaccharide/polyol phosphate transport system ATPase subunit